MSGEVRSSASTVPQGKAPSAEPPRPAPERVSPRERRLPYPIVLVLLGAALAGAVVVSLAVGSVSLPPTDVAAILVRQVVPGWSDPGWPATYDTIVLDVRLPRVLLAGIVGAGLSAVGTALQALVRNPLADPYLLGISSGASLGAVASLVSGIMVLGTLATPMVAAFVGSMITLVTVYALANSGGRMTTTRLVLAGVAVSYVLSALADLLLSTAADPHLLSSIRFWTLGSLAGAEWRTLPIPTTVVLLGLAALLWRAGSLNLLVAGEESAGTLGLDVHRFRTGMFVLVSLMTGAMVAVSGSIGFVGLMVPHAVRMLVGADHRRVLPTAALLGATFLIIADLAARTVAAPQEIQLGVLTALCGGPFFVWLLRRQARRERAVR
ncbi:iron complex transport system permease protein [Actinopolyspora xinjiangensis]|uniref:Iron complex transport system permease protein n=1 Tax=Actinopolyspora xinjiangensis TaxID=405564 RepID=A0A1H0WYQ2_9ACTN|nr:iron ABC transporter permease [Actinopolyspora xinjiangensis]SDP95858.1 iron complex transport system permease protein [Actinopolyspora xinjiangensis]